jgi:hypothetical protein
MMKLQEIIMHKIITIQAQLIPPGEAICFRQLRRDGRDRLHTLDFDDEGDFNIARGAAITEAERDGEKI